VVVFVLSCLVLSVCARVCISATLPDGAHTGHRRLVDVGILFVFVINGKHRKYKFDCSCCCTQGPINCL
jgi:hypothetical protein